MGQPVEAAVQEILRVWGVPSGEACPEYNQHLMQVLGLPAAPLDSFVEVVEGKVWGTRNGVEIRVDWPQGRGLG